MATSNKNSLLPVYLVIGEDELKRETVIRRLHARLEKMGDLSFNSETFSAATCTGEDIVTRIKYFTFRESCSLSGGQ